MIYIVTGYNAESVISSAKTIDGLSKIISVNHQSFEHLLAESIASTLHEVVSSNSFSHVVAPSTNFGKNFFPRFAGLMGVSPVTDVVEILGENEFIRPMYAGNALATLSTSSPTKLITVRITAFEKAEMNGDGCEVEEMEFDPTSDLSSFMSESVSKSERPDLTSADVVVSGGRGMKNGENFEILEKLADKFGGTGLFFLKLSLFELIL